MVPVENRLAFPVMEPRIAKPVGFTSGEKWSSRKYGFSDDCEGCRMAQVAAGAKSHSEVCCERIRQVMMKDDVGQQRLHAAEQRVSPAGELQSVAIRVEAAQDGPGEAMRQAPAASSARNVKPRVEVSLEDSTRVSSRLQDGSPSEEARIGGGRS